MGKKHLIAAEAEGDQRSLWGEAWRRFKKNRLAMIGMYFILALVIIAIATIIIDAVTGKSIYLNYVVKQDLRGRLQGPSLAHPFGLDEFGRDMLLRMLWAVRYSLFMGTVAIVISCIFGGLLGAFAGYYGKTADNIIMRIMDILLAIPSMLLAIAYVPTFARTVRASVLTVKDQEFIEAARSIGCSDWRIIIKYVIPNSMAPIIVQVTLGIAGAILSIAGLSFLGLGIQPPTPEWGAMLSNARSYIRDAWHVTIIPGMGIMLTILALNLVGDGLRDALDPRLKS